MDIRTLTTGAELAELRTEWERLERGDPHAPYYVSHRFVSAWWDAFSRKPGVDLFVVCVVHNNDLVGIAPLSIRAETRKGEAVRVLRFASHGDYMSVLLDPEASSDAVLKNLMSYIEDEPRWDAVHLTNIPGASVFARYLLKSRHNRSFTFQIENPYIDLRDYRDLEDFEAHNLPSKTRTYRNKLLREFDVTFAVVRGNDNDMFARMAALHRTEKQYLVQRKSRTERHSLFDDPFRSRHIESVFARTDDPLTFVYEDPSGELFGYRSCFLHGRRLLSWNSAYNPEHNDLRIGKVLQYDIMRHLFDADLVDVFDLGAGRYPWKFEWTGSFTTTYRLRVPAAGAPNKQAAPAEQQEERSAQHAASGSGAGSRVRARLREVRARLPRLTRPSADAAEKGRGVWYVPHPDDESLFMAGSLYANREAANVVVLLTQGGASKALNAVNERLSRPLSRTEFMSARVREFTSALARLGVERDRVVVLDLPDGGLQPPAVHDVVVRMARQHPGARHHTMSYLDPHADHAAAGEALLSAYERGEIAQCVFHLPVPLVDGDVGAAVPMAADGLVDAKRAALREYGVWDPDRGRYAIGSHSVPNLMKRQIEEPTERIHGPGSRR